MKLENRYNELLKLKRKQLFDLLQKRYNQIVMLYDLVADKNQSIAWVIWQSDSKSKERRFQGGTISTIKHSIENRNKFDAKFASYNIVIAEIFINTFEKALVELASGRLVTEKKSVSLTLPIEHWHLIDQICYNQDTSYAAYFRNLVAKELENKD